MTEERQKIINEWLSIHCQTCEFNDDRGTGYVNCQSECEVVKDIGIECIHYERTNNEQSEGTDE